MPDWDIIPVGFACQNLLPDSIRVPSTWPNYKLAEKIAEQDKRFDLENARLWSSIHELIIGAWMLNTSYDKVLIYEYDVFQNCPLYKFFEEPKNDVMWCSHDTPENSKNKTFVRWYKELSPDTAESSPVRDNIASCGTLFQLYDGGSLNKLVIGMRENKYLYRDCFCELVIGIEARINNLDIGTWEPKLKPDPITDYFRPSEFRSDKVKEMKRYNVPLWTHPDKE